MARKKTPHVTVTYLDFNSLAGKSPQEVYRQFQISQRVSDKAFFQKSVQWDSYRVTQAEGRITIHLAQDGQEVAYFSFVPGPRYR